MPTLIARFYRGAVCAGLLCLSGCPAAALLDKVSDPHDPAKYTPQRDNALVLVEDYQNPALVEDLIDHMDELIGEELVANKVAPVVNPERLTLMRLNSPDEYKKLRIADIGSRLGARQLIYVNITDMATSTAAGTSAVMGHAEARVKIVDCVSGQTRWPRDAASAGYPVRADIPFSADMESANPRAVREALARDLSSKIAKLFYSAVIEQSDPAPHYPETDLK